VIFFKPTAVASHVTKITPKYLKEKGIRNLILDVDGTIAEWNTREMRPDVVRWMRTMRRSGIKLGIASNHLSPAAHQRLMDQLQRHHLKDIPAIYASQKPRRTNVFRMMADHGFPVKDRQTAIVGDQYTFEVALANRLHLPSIHVGPAFPERQTWWSRALRGLDAMTRRPGTVDYLG